MTTVDVESSASLMPVTPIGLSVCRFRVGAREYAVLSFPTETATLPASITAVEREVLAALVLGLSNRDIASRRGTAERTVANQVQAIFRKLGVHSRAELSACLASRSRIRERA